MTTRIITVLLLGCSIVSQAQSKLKDFFTSTDTPITWLGVDYSQAKYVGDLGTVDQYEIRRYFNKINELILNEPEKFDLNRAFHKDNVFVEVDPILDRNDAVKAKEIISRRSSRAYRLNNDSVRQIVKSYELPKSLSGIGVVFIAEAIDKNREETAFYVTGFDMQSRSILFIERVIGEAGGFGFRNHWATCIHEVLEDLDRSLYRNWRRKYLEDLASE
jgi:hypothetical protein